MRSPTDEGAIRVRANATPRWLRGLTRPRTAWAPKVSGAHASLPVVPVIEFDVCWDTSEVDVVGQDGGSVQPADLPTRGITRVGVANYEYPDGSWLVAYTEAQKGKTC